MRKSIHNSKAKGAEPVDVRIGIPGFGDIFKGLGGFIELVGEMAEKGEETKERTGEIKIPGGRAMYGFSVRIGGAGIPKIERFGNVVHRTEEGPIVEEVREPFVDIFEEGEKLEAIVELPGVEEKDISYEIKDDVLILNASGDGRKYSREALLPFRAVLLSSAYKNGILRLTMQKQKPAK